MVKKAMIKGDDNVNEEDNDDDVVLLDSPSLGAGVGGDEESHPARVTIARVMMKSSELMWKDCNHI